MDDAELGGLRAMMGVESYHPHQKILSEGATGDEFYVVVKGNAVVQVLDAGGNQMVVEEVGPGGFFGELSTSYLTLRQSRSTKMLSKARPRPSMLMLIGGWFQGSGERLPAQSPSNPHSPKPRT